MTTTKEAIETVREVVQRDVNGWHDLSQAQYESALEALNTLETTIEKLTDQRNTMEAWAEDYKAQRDNAQEMLNDSAATIERLTEERDALTQNQGKAQADWERAATESLDRLQSENDRLREALERIVAFDRDYESAAHIDNALADACNIARTALSQQKKD